MKRIFFLFGIILFLNLGCSKDEDSEKYCWNFRIRVMTTIISGGVQKSSSVFTVKKQCDLTEAEAEQVKKDTYNMSTGYSNGNKVTIITEVITYNKI